MRKLENRHVLESQGTNDKKSAKYEQLRLEYSMNLNELQRNLESICKLADSLKKEKNELQITLEKHEIKKQDLIEENEKLTEKLEQLENSIENHTEDLELSLYSPLMEHSSSEIQIKKSPSKRKKCPKRVSGVKSLQFIPAQIAQMKKIKENLMCQIAEMRLAIEKNEQKNEEKKNLLGFVEGYKLNNYGKILVEELNSEKNIDSEVFVQSINISMEEVQSTNPNTSKTKPKKKEKVKEYKSSFTHISLYASILCINII